MMARVGASAIAEPTPHKRIATRAYPISRPTRSGAAGFTGGDPAIRGAQGNAFLSF